MGKPARGEQDFKISPKKQQGILPLNLFLHCHYLASARPCTWERTLLWKTPSQRGFAIGLSVVELSALDIGQLRNNELSIILFVELFKQNANFLRSHLYIKVAHQANPCRGILYY